MAYKILSSETVAMESGAKPQITAEVLLKNKAELRNIWNSSATDFVFDQTWTDYIFVPLYHA